MSDDLATLVRQKLQASRLAHASYRLSIQQKNKIAARTELEMAMRLRREAIALDVHRESPAWLEEQSLTPKSHDTHDSLLSFYEAQLAKSE